MEAYTEGLMFGCLLGDGYINHNNRDDSYYLSFQHSVAQKDYAFHKGQRLQELTGYKMNAYKINCGGQKALNGIANDAIRVQLKLPRGEGRYYHRLVYPNNNKTVSRKMLNKISPEALAWWWMDDGCLSIYTPSKVGKGTQRYGKLCTHGFSEAENILIQRYFKVAYNVETKVKIEKNKYFFQYFNVGALKPFFHAITPYVHNTLLYKVDMRYKRNSYEQKFYDTRKSSSEDGDTV